LYEHYTGLDYAVLVITASTCRPRSIGYNVSVSIQCEPKKLYIFNAPYRCNCSRQNEMFYTKMFRKDTRPKIYLHAVMKYSFKINSIYCTKNVCET